MDKYGVGAKHTTKYGECIEITKIIDYEKRNVRFENGYEVFADMGSIRRGTVRNPYRFSVYGVGFLGIGDYKAKLNFKNTSEYEVWTSMLKRCCNEKYQEKHPTYKGVTVCENWRNFQNFARFYNDNHPKVDGIKFHLDKDLLQQSVKNKIYSPDTCIFLPHNINTFLNNKYSTNTSGYIGVNWNKKDKKWKSQIRLFEEGKQKYLGYFSTPELASQVYQEAREIEVEKAKNYLRSLNYLPEHIIQLIK